MKLFVEPMNATVLDVDGQGRVNIENEGWITPSLQERRAIIYAAELAMSAMTELLEILQGPDSSR